MIEFVKMHGLGNDYVYIDAGRFPVDDPPALSRRISNRHTGVGSDGLILLLPSDDPDMADIRMRMFNADGSESELCGNGIRCVGKLAYEDRLCPTNPIRVATGAGVLTLLLDIAGDIVRNVTVDMGEPIVRPADIPMRWSGEEPVIAHPLDGHIAWDDVNHANWMNAAGFERRLSCISMGNPHAIAFCTNVDAVPLEHYGEWLEHHQLFPQRVNAHVVECMSRDELRMRTWERGTGITQACGTGACAVAVASVLAGRTHHDVLIHLPGGDLRIRWDGPGNTVRMTGPAVEVFRGTFDE